MFYNKETSNKGNIDILYDSYKISYRYVDPAFSIARMRFPLDGELDFYLKNDFYWLFENDLESPLIFVLFLKGKQNKKEKP